jgi:hypothetical protein
MSEQSFTTLEESPRGGQIPQPPKPEAVTATGSASAARSAPWLMLIARPALFLGFQALFALLLGLTGSGFGWVGSVKWWMFAAILANLVCIYLLRRLFRAEGRRYLDILRFSRATVKMDLVWLFVTGIIGFPIAAAPMNTLAVAIFGDAMAPTRMMFQPLPAWALVAGLLFPLTIAFAELPTYFGYSMPRLAAQLKNGWAAWLIASFFLAAQHMFLPFVFDGNFLLWRLGMYLPFALFVGLLLKLRPSLLPYFVIVHALMDLSTWAVYFMV